MGREKPGRVCERGRLRIDGREAVISGMQPSQIRKRRAAADGGGRFDFRERVLAGLGLTMQQLSWRISDHYPLWAEFSARD